jgi:hypothetical protein
MLALLMGFHERLGAQSRVRTLDPDLVPRNILPFLQNHVHRCATREARRIMQEACHQSMQSERDRDSTTHSTTATTSRVHCHHPSPFTKTTAGQGHKPTNGNRGKSADSPATAGAPNQPLAKLLVSTLTAQKTPTHPPSSARHHASAAEPLPLSQKAYHIQQRFLQQARDIFRLPSPLDASCLALSEDEACALTSLHDSQTMMGTLLHMLHKTPLRVLDAFAGAGGSCIYLMHFLPPSSHIIAVQKADTAVEKGTLQRLLHNTAAFRRVDKRRICTTSLQVMAGDVRSVLARHS